jgi:plasmid stabilization system protein ParE
MKVRVTDDAAADLRQIKDFISRDKPGAAAGAIERIRRCIGLLAVLPRLGHGGIVPGTFEKSVPRVPYVIVYRIEKSDTPHELVVLRVYHTAQDR